MRQVTAIRVSPTNGARMSAIEGAMPASNLPHAMLDNFASRKHPKVLAWLA